MVLNERFVDWEGNILILQYNGQQVDIETVNGNTGESVILQFTQGPMEKMLHDIVRFASNSLAIHAIVKDNDKEKGNVQKM